MSASSSVPRNHRIRVIESHTAGEPTRVVVEGGPDLGQGDLAERTERFRRDFDHYRSAIVNEPHGSDVMVGALIVEPTDPTCSAGVIFFNNVGYLGMCGHGTMGVMVSLKHMGRITSGLHRIETPVGVVTTTLSDDGSVTVDNVACHVAARDLALELPGKTTVKGDIAWGGNWFFLTQAPDMALNLAHAQDLTDYAWAIRQAINAQGHQCFEN